MNIETLDGIQQTHTHAVQCTRPMPFGLWHTHTILDRWFPWSEHVSFRAAVLTPWPLLAVCSSGNGTPGHARAIQSDDARRCRLQNVTFAQSNLVPLLICRCPCLNVLVSLYRLAEDAKGGSIEKKLDGSGRWCRKCVKVKPDRTHHCRVCNRCEHAASMYVPRSFVIVVVLFQMCLEDGPSLPLD